MIVMKKDDMVFLVYIEKESKLNVQHDFNSYNECSIFMFENMDTLVKLTNELEIKYGENYD